MAFFLVDFEDNMILQRLDGFFCSFRYSQYLWKGLLAYVSHNKLWYTRTMKWRVRDIRHRPYHAAMHRPY